MRDLTLEESRELEGYYNQVSKMTISKRGKDMSMGGRMMMLNAVLSNLPLYSFSFYKVSKVIIKEMIRMQRDFLWGGVEGRKKNSWISWDNICICRSKKEGLGIKHYGEFNLALLNI